MALTTEEVAFFRHCGFLKLPAPLPPAMVGALNGEIQRGIREAAEPVKRDRAGRIVRLSDLWSRGGIFREALTCPEVLDPLESLLGPNIVLVRNRHNHACLRLADDGSAYMHRDLLQWSRPLVTVIFYLEETTQENGCTRVVPGSHFFPGRPAHALEADRAVLDSRLLEQAVPLPMPAGGLIAMDSLLFHGAGSNRTGGTRTSLTVGYHSVDELAEAPDPKRVLVRGVNLYRGNDY